MKTYKAHSPIAHLIVSLLPLGATADLVAQEEYFGTFSGEPSFSVKTNASGRPTFILLQDFQFTDPNGLRWTTPKGWEVDGASIPRIAWSVVGGPMSGKYLYASVIHDRYCDTKTRTALATHRTFYYGMKASGVSDGKAKVMYWAVRTFGPSWKITRAGGRFGFRGPATNTLAIDVIEPPNVPDKKLKELLDGIKPNMTVAELDSLSDSIREEYGSQKLQKEAPKP